MIFLKKNLKLIMKNYKWILIRDKNFQFYKLKELYFYFLNKNRDLKIQILFLYNKFYYHNNKLIGQ